MERDEGIRRQLGRMARGEDWEGNDDEEDVKRKRMFDDHISRITAS